MSVPPVVHVPSTALSPLIPATNMNGFLPNTTYYRMQVFYYPTLPISQSNCLQTGQISTVPTTFVLRGKIFVFFFKKNFHLYLL